MMVRSSRRIVWLFVDNIEGVVGELVLTQRRAYTDIFWTLGHADSTVWKPSMLLVTSVQIPSLLGWGSAKPGSGASEGSSAHL